MMTTYYSGYQRVTTAGTSVTSSPWNNWTADTSANTTSNIVWGSWVEYKVRVEDMKQEERIEHRKNKFLGAMHTKFSYWETTRKARVSVNMKKWADIKAKILLRSLLTKVQLERFDRDECIPVDTAKENKYLIRKGRVKNVEVLNCDGSVKHRLCVHPQEEVPDYDTMIAQLLYLKTDEESLIRMANIHP